MDQREAHDLVLSLAENYPGPGTANDEQRKSAIQITRRDLQAHQRAERKERDRKKPEDPRDDLPMNRAQVRSLYKIWMRDHRGLSFADVLDLAEPAFDGSGAVMINHAGIVIGIEADGYAHS